MRLSNPTSSGPGLRPRGAFDPLSTDYQPGDAVADSGLTYVCTGVPGLVADTRVDSFDRPDRAGDWGTATGGFVWADAGIGFATGTLSVASGAGVQTGNGDGNGRFMRAGEALASADQELVLRWTLTTSALGDHFVTFYLRSTPDTSVTQAALSFKRDGTWTLEIYGGGNHDSTSGTWAAAASGASVWLRYRAEGQTYSWRTWADGAEEPADWDQTYTAPTAVDTASCALVVLGSNTPGATGDTLAIDHFSVSTLAPSVTPAPSGDPTHWALLAAAAPGTPTLIGPMVVDFSDIPLDGNTKTLFTSEPGTVLLRLFPDTDPAHLTQWDVGTLYVGQDVSGSAFNYVTGASAGYIGTTQGQSLDSVGSAVTGYAYQGNEQDYASATVFHSADPVQVLFSNPGDDPGPAFGHVALYALIARPVPVAE